MKIYFYLFVFVNVSNRGNTNEKYYNSFTIELN